MVFKKWKFKAAAQKMISLLPFRNRINFWFQQYVTRGVRLDEEHLHWKLTHASDHLTYLHKYSHTTAPVCLELGTGWYPIVPIMLYLHGAQKIQTTDLNAHLTKDTLQTSIKKIKDLESAGKLIRLFPQIQTDRWEQFNQVATKMSQLTLKEMLTELNIEAIVGDARHLPMSDQTFDFICSNNTFEHIFPGILTDILQEFKRVLKPGGVMSHFINLSDHFAHFDSSINIYNFLQFSEKQWSRIDNIIQPQNRWRWRQYQALYQSLNIPITEEAIRPGEVGLLRQISIHPEWQGYTYDEMAISHGYIVSILK